MPFLDYDITDDVLDMPNGDTLTVTSGTIPLHYEMHRGDRTIGEPDRFPEWDVDGSTVEVDAIDRDEREVSLVLPVRHPAIRALINRSLYRIHDRIVHVEGMF